MEEEGKALEEIIKNTFCNLNSVVACDYYTKSWCPKTCGFYKRAENKARYWNH